MREWCFERQSRTSFQKQRLSRMKQLGATPSTSLAGDISTSFMEQNDLS
jgi:hypothetical protein